MCVARRPDCGTGNTRGTNCQADKTGKINLYEGAGYSLKGVYRPYPDCRMRTNENPEFCPVCRRAITQLINFYTK